MKEIPILINKRSLQIQHILPSSLEYIHDYIDYKLYPYKKLYLFTYNTYSNAKKPLDGMISPSPLTNILHSFVFSHSYKNAPSFDINEINFFNAETQCFNLSSNEYELILGNPQFYCIIFTLLYN